MIFLGGPGCATIIPTSPIPMPLVTFGDRAQDRNHIILNKLFEFKNARCWPIAATFLIPLIISFDELFLRLLGRLQMAFRVQLSKTFQGLQKKLAVQW